MASTEEVFLRYLIGGIIILIILIVCCIIHNKLIKD